MIVDVSNNHYEQVREAENMMGKKVTDDDVKLVIPDCVETDDNANVVCGVFHLKRIWRTFNGGYKAEYELLEEADDELDAINKIMEMNEKKGE